MPRGITSLGTGKILERNRSGLPTAQAGFPGRPDPRVLSESIPLYFITKNAHGFWIARGADGRTGGIFLFKRSALRFARRRSTPQGCATVTLTDRLELDVENQGNPLAALLNAGMRIAAWQERKPGVIRASGHGLLDGAPSPGLWRRSSERNPVS